MEFDRDFFIKGGCALMIAWGTITGLRSCETDQGVVSPLKPMDVTQTPMEPHKTEVMSAELKAVGPSKKPMPILSA